MAVEISGMSAFWIILGIPAIIVILVLIFFMLVSIANKHKKE